MHKRYNTMLHENLEGCWMNRGSVAGRKSFRQRGPGLGILVLTVAGRRWWLAEGAVRRGTTRGRCRDGLGTSLQP